MLTGLSGFRLEQLLSGCQTCIHKTEGSGPTGQRKESRERAGKVGKWGRDGRVTNFLGIFLVMRIENHESLSSVQRQTGKPLSVQPWVLMVYRRLSFAHWPTKGPLCLQQQEPTSSAHHHCMLSWWVPGQSGPSNHEGNRRYVSWISGPLVTI